MAQHEKILLSFIYIADTRPVLIFEDAKDAAAFAKGFKGAEIYAEPHHVFLPKPHGLECVRGAKNGRQRTVSGFIQERVSFHLLISR